MVYSDVCKGETEAKIYFKGENPLCDSVHSPIFVTFRFPHFFPRHSWRTFSLRRAGNSRKLFVFFFIIPPHINRACPERWAWRSRGSRRGGPRRTGTRTEKKKKYKKLKYGSVRYSPRHGTRKVQSSKMTYDPRAGRGKPLYIAKGAEHIFVSNQGFRC